MSAGASSRPGGVCCSLRPTEPGTWWGAPFPLQDPSLFLPRRPTPFRHLRLPHHPEPVCYGREDRIYNPTR
ncbi:hypothetical protein E2C01_006693 [Portunus trituberculatus]|uniref:Uncharacterized protein n=1 Tax=Portunus trituberculatus TaxID=210409 RepID=A0A5B7D2I1_PORTR|nr:hypothetical protein [Portunus trituberculatus]